METIKAKCNTNLDNYDCFVTEFVALPRKGDNVAVLLKGQRTYLKVVSILHTEDKHYKGCYIEVELNK